MAIRFVFDPRYAEAIFHLRVHRVFGKRLRPFSRWHLTQLEFHNSPFIAGGEITVPDLELAVAVCRSKFPVRAELLVRGRIQTFFWSWRASRVNLKTEAARFQDYIADFFSPAKLWHTKGSGGRRDIDESLEEVALYREYTGCAREEPWNMPIGELYWMNTLFARRAGANVRVWTPADERAWRQNLKRREEILQRLTKEMLEQNPSLSPDEARKNAEQFYWKRVRENKKKHGH